MTEQDGTGDRHDWVMSPSSLEGWTDCPVCGSPHIQIRLWDNMPSAEGPYGHFPRAVLNCEGCEATSRVHIGMPVEQPDEDSPGVLRKLREGFRGIIDA